MYVVHESTDKKTDNYLQLLMKKGWIIKLQLYISTNKEETKAVMQNKNFYLQAEHYWTISVTTDKNITVDVHHLHYKLSHNH